MRNNQVVLIFLVLTACTVLSAQNNKYPSEPGRPSERRPGGEVIWVDDALPEPIVTSNIRWVTDPQPHLGQQSFTSESHNENEYWTHSYFAGARPLNLTEHDILYAYVYIDEEDAPSEIVLQFSDKEWDWDHRVFWGDGHAKNYVTFRAGDLPEKGTWAYIEIPAKRINLDGKEITGLSIVTNGGRVYWDEIGKFRSEGAKDPPVPGDIIWFDDQLPHGSKPYAIDDVWDWRNDLKYFGSLSHQSYLGPGSEKVKYRKHFFTGANPPLELEESDVLFTYVYIHPSHVPDEIMLEWYDGKGWEHRAYWGANYIQAGITGSDSRRYMGPVPPSGSWVKLEVPAIYVGLQGKKVTGMSFSVYREVGRPWAAWDTTGRTRIVGFFPYSKPTNPIPLYRFWSNNTKYSLSTNDIGRADQILQGEICKVYGSQIEGTVPVHVFRYRVKKHERYFYTIAKDAGERMGWRYEGIAFYVYKDATPLGAIPLYQFNSSNGYVYTTNPSEGGLMIPNGLLGYVHPR
jgi:hypothetical protein